jgi:hypothetical protein
MSWEGFMKMEHRQLRERLQGKLRRTLGVALTGESVEEPPVLGVASMASMATRERDREVARTDWPQWRPAA